MSNADRIILVKLGKLHANGHGLFGYCRVCDCHFGIPLPVLIAAPGADSLVVHMRPGQMRRLRWPKANESGDAVREWRPDVVDKSGQRP